MDVSSSGGRRIASTFVVDADFYRLYARHTMSKRVFAILLAVGVAAVWASFLVLRLPHGSLRVHLRVIFIVISFWGFWQFSTTSIALVRSHHLQRVEIHMVGGKWCEGVLVMAEVTDSSASVSRSATECGSGERPPSKRVRKMTEGRYRDFPLLEGTYSLDEVTRVVWSEGYALLVVGGMARTLPSETYRAMGIREAPAIPVALGPLGEDGRRRLRALLDERGISVRRVRR